MLAPIFVVLLASAASCYDGDRIINGTKVMQGEYPQVVSLQIKLKGSASGFNFCGGTILNRNFVLTAAHCVKRKRSEELMIVSSTVTLNLNARIYDAVDIIVHENFNDSRFNENDIALIQVSPPFDLQDGFEAEVKVPHNFTDPPPGVTATVVGWGFVKQSPPTHTKDLYKVDQELIGNDECGRILHEHLLDSMICAGDRITKSGACYGDSGGPMFVDGVQVGIASWIKDPCGTKPAVFTRVSHFIDWIETNVKVPQ